MPVTHGLALAFYVLMVAPSASDMDLEFHSEPVSSGYLPQAYEACQQHAALFNALAPANGDLDHYWCEKAS